MTHHNEIAAVWDCCIDDVTDVALNGIEVYGRKFSSSLVDVINIAVQKRYRAHLGIIQLLLLGPHLHVDRQ